MADIVSLSQHRGPASGRVRSPGPGGHDATILLFTGVRYERLETAALPALPVLPASPGQPWPALICAPRPLEA